MAVEKQETRGASVEAPMKCKDASDGDRHAPGQQWLLSHWDGGMDRRSPKEGSGGEMQSHPPHTDPHLDVELDALRQQLLEMGVLVEQQIGNALAALVQRDSELARRTIMGDEAVNRIDAEVDASCIRLLARYQPIARDLRLITTGLKITTDLERMGDLAVNICERAEELNAQPPLLPLIDIPGMAAIAQRMVRDSLDAFVREDIALALTVCGADDEIDALNNQLSRILLTYIAENPRTVARVIQLSFVAKCLERIADHATNVAEMVIFMVKGKNIRHLASLPANLPERAVSHLEGEV